MPTLLRSFALAASALVLAGPSLRAQAVSAPAVPDDPFVWLEEVESERSLSWVRDRNARSLGILQGDSRYAPLHAAALEIVHASDRIPSPSFLGDAIVNFWQDPTHVRGIWRRTTLDSYRSNDPQWTTILDVDAIARAENANWVYRGANCLPPAYRYCLISLSDGGKDAVTVREYDVEARRFIANGFVLPEGKQSATWVDRNTLLVGREWTPGEVTGAGYAYVVKRVTRGQRLDHAREVFRGRPTDVSASAFTLRDADGLVRAVMIVNGRTFWEADYHLLTTTGTVPLLFPARVNLQGIVGDRLVFTTNQDWNEWRSGDVLSYDLATLLARPADARAALVVRPGPREAVQGTTLTRNQLIVALYENVRGAAYAFAPGPDGWTRTRLAIPKNLTVGLGSATRRSDRLFVSVSGFTTPSTLLLADVAAGTVEPVKASPPKFDATGLVVEQYEATSSDGTRIPYFIVRKEGAPRDGTTPTLLYGYGGFQSSQLPSYSALRGKLWLERGGAYAVANTRGGGEFGPSWHQAAIGANRRLAHDDFIAVAEDLIAKGFTSPRRLGIMGGSQGGLFVGVAMTKRPELFNAVVIQVPLFDMLRYHRLLAGASWMGEYGNPDIPEERAWIAEYSPYQAIAPGRAYPEPLILTSTKDDRVHPGHARKAAAKLESLGYPYLYYENTDGGHGAAANLLETARRATLEYVYLTRKLMDTP
ncbi:MAG: prolyl oligopeptidase family serine peptidase [Gemmatimonadaceae bacterium]